MSTQMTEQFSTRIQYILTDNILKFWIEKAIDHDCTMPYGKVDSSGFPEKNVAVGGILAVRILWALSAAYNALGDTRYLEYATRMKDCIVTHFFDTSEKAIYYSVAPDGSVIDANKATDCQAYAIYALCEYYKATRDLSVFEIAFALFKNIEAKAMFPENGGYADWLSSDMHQTRNPESAIRTLNTHLHLLEAYTVLYRISGNGDVYKYLLFLFDVIVNRFYENGFFYNSLSSEWLRITDETLYGINLETSWLLIEAATALSYESRERRAIAILDECASLTLSYATDKDHAIFYAGNATQVIDTDKQWWVQAESAVAFLIAYEKTGNHNYFDAFYSIWNYIINSLVDYDTGEWRLGFSGDEIMADDHRSGFWKCPYHTTRTCIEALKRKEIIDTLVQDPGNK